MLKISPLLTIEDAYDASQCFIEKYYNITDSFDGGIIASEMTLMENNRPFDDAIWEDWLEALATIKPNEKIDLETTRLTIEEAYFAMIKFLEIYCSMGANNDFIECVAQLKTNTSTILTWQNWVDSIKEITSHSPRKRPYFELLPK